MNIVNVGYDSTNYYILADTRPRLLIDVGFPGTLPKLRHACKRFDVDLSALKHVFCTHYHPDHAGLIEELKRTGVTLVAVDLQLPFVPALKRLLKPGDQFIDIDLRRNAVTVTLDESRAFLTSIGISGQLLATPGHSDDSVSLVLDNGAAFTGDLPPVADDTVERSWDVLRCAGARVAYPGHGPVRPLP